MADGQIIVVGGANEDKFIPMFVERAGGSQARLFILAAGRISKESQLCTINAYREDFKKLGVHTIYSPLILSREIASSNNVLEQMKKATGICVSGGDQEVLMERIGGTKLHSVILTKFQQGCIYYGNSAGAMVVGEMIIFEDDETHKIIVEKGLGLIKGVVVDSHFSERKRMQRLRDCVSCHSGLKGVGVDEETAIIWSNNNNKREVVGKGRAYYFNSGENSNMGGG